MSANITEISNNMRSVRWHIIIDLTHSRFSTIDLEYHWYSISMFSTYLLLLFLVYGLHMREQSSVRGKELIEWVGRQGRSNES